ncbi:hypothetical protein OROMI_019053 [Orobanche minor]
MGRKRVSVDSKFQSKKCGKKRCCYSNSDDFDDGISRLPDDILVVILSLIPLKEAACTSVLSSRWIDLWKHNPYLDFDAVSVLHKIAKQPKLRYQERRKYIRWVDSILQSHKALSLKELRIPFDLDKSARSQSAITKWLQFAFARRVERLELVLEYGDDLLDLTKNYVFPRKKMLEKYAPPTSLVSLKALTLKCVNVTGEAIDFFLRNCPFLEKLIVHGTTRIFKIEVCGLSSLKHLELFRCCGLKSVRVSSAPNLATLLLHTFKGLLLQNSPKLVEVSVVCANHGTRIKDVAPALSCCINQLEKLTLRLYAPDEIIVLSEFPQLPKLKRLVVEYWGQNDESLMGLTSFIRASPCLQEFVLQLRWYKLSRTYREVVMNVLRSPHQHLKVFKFAGYYGRVSDVELVRYILDNCVVLEKITIDPKYQKYMSHIPVSRDKLDWEQTARRYAKQQLEEAQVPKHIELVIL